MKKRPLNDAILSSFDGASVSSMSSFSITDSELGQLGAFRDRGSIGNSAAHTEVALDLYETPSVYVEKLIPYLQRLQFSVIYEPCAGNGAIVDALRSVGYTTKILSLNK